MNKVESLISLAKNFMPKVTRPHKENKPSHEQVRNNKHSARAKKGWVTRRRNSMQKKAEDADSVREVKLAVRTLGSSLDHPSRAASYYAKRKLLNKVRSMIGTKPKAGTNGTK